MRRQHVAACGAVAMVTTESLSRRVPMRHLTTAALVLYLGVASLYAQQFREEHATGRRVKMRFSGSIISSPLSLAPDTLNHEEHLAGNSTLGPFTYRGLWADDPATQTPGNCGGAVSARTSTCHRRRRVDSRQGSRCRGTRRTIGIRTRVRWPAGSWRASTAATIRRLPGAASRTPVSSCRSTGRWATASSMR